MSMVQHTPDNTMIVRSGTQVYIDTLEHFAIDFGEPAPPMYPGSTDCVYEPGIRHVYTDNFNILGAGPVPWAAGDRFIANIAAALASQATRPPDIVTPEELHAKLNP